MMDSENVTSSSPSKGWSETRRGRVIIFVGVMGLFVLVFWMAMKSRRMLAPNPTLVVDERYLSFGEVWEDSVFAWTLPIRNTTNKDIEIIDFTTDCSCGKIDPRSLKIPAQETREVRLTLDLRAPHNESDPKTVLSTLDLNGKSFPEKGRHKFAIKIVPIFPYGLVPREGWEIHGRVLVPAELIPSTLAFEYLEKKPPESLSQAVKIKCLYPCEKVTAKCDGNFASVQVTKDNKTSDVFHLDVKPSTALTVGKHVFAIELRLWMTRTQDYATIKLPVSIEVKSEFFFIPAFIHWGGIITGERSTELVQVRSRSGKNFSVIKTECGSANVKVAPLEPVGSSTHIFRVECCFTNPGEYIENVDFFVKVEGGQPNSKSESDRIRLKVKYQVFSK